MRVVSVLDRQNTGLRGFLCLLINFDGFELFFYFLIIEYRSLGLIKKIFICFSVTILLNKGNIIIDIQMKLINVNSKKLGGKKIFFRFNSISVFTILSKCKLRNLRLFI